MVNDSFLKALSGFCKIEGSDCTINVTLCEGASIDFFEKSTAPKQAYIYSYGEIAATIGVNGLDSVTGNYKIEPSSDGESICILSHTGREIAQVAVEKSASLEKPEGLGDKGSSS